MDGIIQTFGLLFGTLIMVLMTAGFVLWLALPFVVYQIRNRLDQQIKETQELRFSVKYLINTLEKYLNTPQK